MGTFRTRPRKAYGMGDNLLSLSPLPIVSQRAPKVTDRAEIGTIWVDQPNDDSYILTRVAANTSTWINAGGGTGTFNALNVTTTAVIGTALTLTAGNLTLGAMATAGVLSNTAAGVIQSSAGTDGQLFTGATGAAPAWATVVSGDGSVVIAGGANTLDLRVSGAAASTFPCDGGTATPILGATTITGGTNITTGGAGGTVTIDQDAAPTHAGLLTCQLGIDVSGANAVLTSASNTGQDIYLHADGGIAETIDIHADQGTGINALASVYVHSDVGGITIDSAIASADAVVITASDAVGGIDMDCGSGDFTLDSGGSISIDAVDASNVTVTGAGLDLTLGSVGGSVVVTASEAAATAVQLTASDAAGGITAATGTGGLTVNSTNGVIALNSGTAAINVGTDAAAHIVTVGNQNTTSQTVIHSGTGDININSTDAVTVDATGLFSIDSALTSNVTVTGASEDLQLYSVGGAVVLDGSEAVATAISLNASDGAGGVTIAAGTGGLLFGNQADCTTVDLGNFAPTAARTITVGGGTVITAAVTDTIDIAPDGATTNANSIKQVNVNTGVVAVGESLTYIATGAVTSGTHTVGIQTGNVTAGTVAANVSTGTGTKTVNVGNADGLTTVNIDAITLINNDINVNTSINTGTSTGVVAIGNAAAGAISADTAAGISLDAATASNFTVTGAADLTLQSTLGGVDIISALAAADAIVLNASDAAGGIDVDCGTAGFILTAVNGPLTVVTGTGQVDISADATANTVNVGTGAGVKAVTIGSTNTTSATTIQSGSGDVSITSTDDITLGATGDLSLDGATVDLNGTAGATSMTPAVASVGGVALTINGRVGVATFTGQTTGAGADLDLDITNSFVTAGIGVFVTVNNEGTNDADITIEGVNTHTAGHLIVHCINSGAAALNGNVTVTFWVIN